MILGGSPAPRTDRDALSRAMSHASSAAYMASRGAWDSARKLIDLARIPAARAFPAGSREAEALAVVLAAIALPPLTVTTDQDGRRKP